MGTSCALTHETFFPHFFRTGKLQTAPIFTGGFLPQAALTKQLMSWYNPLPRVFAVGTLHSWEPSFDSCWRQSPAVACVKVALLENMQCACLPYNGLVTDSLWQFCLGLLGRSSQELGLPLNSKDNGIWAFTPAFCSEQWFSICCVPNSFIAFFQADGQNISLKETRMGSAPAPQHPPTWGHCDGNRVTFTVDLLSERHTLC